MDIHLRKPRGDESMTDRFRVICYKRLKESTEPMSWEHARKERLVRQLMHPDRFYVNEEVKQ
jgi:hypothetical protein